MGFFYNVLENHLQGIGIVVIIIEDEIAATTWFHYFLNQSEKFFSQLILVNGCLHLYQYFMDYLKFITTILPRYNSIDNLYS